MKEITRDTQCWNHKNCPEHVKSQCPAFTKGEGRICFSVTGTLCRGEKQAEWAKKIDKCRKCDFGQAMGA